MVVEIRLPALPLPGLSPDSLGNYLASLGLLRVLSRKWPSTRIAWRDEVLQVVGGPSTLDELLDELVRVASERAWTPYERGWLAEQTKGTKLGQKKSTASQAGAPIAAWRAEQPENAIGVLDSHIVATTRQMFNPLTGNGGSAGNRDFSDGWRRATNLLAAPGKQDIRGHLRDLLLGDAVIWLVTDVPLEGKKKKGSLNAASWFSASNKLYNNGQKPSREAGVSPWAMVLACEGLPFFAGGVSRRLGVRTRAVGAFPFVTQPAAPEAAGEAGRIIGELWTPIWARPMTLAETTTLFSRGRAELGGRGAVTPAAFATAIHKRGVDAGVSEFRRFTLGRTTSANTFESRLEDRISLDSGSDAISAAVSRVLECVTALIEQRGFPHERKVGQRWRFEGLRGPIESALLDVAAEPNRAEAAIAMLDAIITALDRIDRNRGFREGKVRWEPLPLAWLPSLFADEQPGAEAGLALSLVSAFPVALPFAAFRFGVEWAREKNGKYEYDWTTKPAWFEHSKVAPARWVWGPGELARVVGRVLSRKLLEEAKLDGVKMTRPPGRAPLPATISQVRQWLAGDVDEWLVSAWLSRLALFDWRRVPQEVHALIHEEVQAQPVDGELALLGLMQPLVDQRPLVVNLSPNDLFTDETGARTTEVACSLVTLIRAGNTDAARRLASSRYAMAGARIASSEAPWLLHDPDRLVAALLFTISDRDRVVLFERWLRPRRQQPGGEAYV